MYVDGVTGSAPGAAWTVAQAMASQYGVPAAEAHARLTAGAFCVRTNVDRATAERFAGELSAMGARVRIEPSEPPPVVGRKPTRSALPAQPAMSGRATRPSLLEPAVGRRVTRSSLLEMGMGSGEPPQALGALAGGELSLSMLDDEPPASRTTTSVAEPRAPARTAVRRLPTDLFAPPLELADEAPVELALEAPAVGRAATAPAVGRAATAPAVGRAMTKPGRLGASPAPGEAGLDADVAAASKAIMAMRAQAMALPPLLADGGELTMSRIPESTNSWLADPRRLMARPQVRTATGVALAIMIGFLPADLFTSSRERALLGPIDQQVIATQTAADTPEAYQALDAYRDRQLAAKRDQYRWIVLGAMLIWAATGSLVGYLWFRKIRWPEP
ncbi:MAG TPA: hypothetical protein VGC42_22730 [Kofleriaceae bacterium]